MANVDQKTLIKEIKSHIKEINKRTGSKISYNDLYNKMDAISKMADEGEKDFALTELYIELSKAMSAKMLSKRVEINSNELIDDKNHEHPARRYSITDASLESRGLVEEIYKLLNPEFDGDFRLSDKQLKAIRDYELEEINKFSSYNEIPKYIEKWNRKHFDKDLEKLNENFPEVKGTLKKYKYKGDINNPKDVMAAEFYYKAYLAKKELDSHGAIWRFFFYKTVDAYDRYIDAVERALLSAEIDVTFNEPIEENKSVFNLLNNRPASSLSGEAEEINKIYDIYKVNTKEAYAKQYNIPLNNDKKIENETDKNIVKPEVKSEEKKPEVKPVEKKPEVKKEEPKQPDKPESGNNVDSANNDIEKAKEKLSNINEGTQEYADEVLKIQAMLEAALAKEMEAHNNNFSSDVAPPVTVTNKKDEKVVKK